MISFASPEIQQRVRDLQEESTIELSNQSKERARVGEVTMAFQSTDLWKSAADFKTQTATKLGFTLTRETEGSSRLEMWSAR